MRSIAEIEAELKEAQAAEAQRIQAERATVEPLWEYTVTPASRVHDVIYDESILPYFVGGRMVNRAEWEAVGNRSSDWDADGRGMVYYYNTNTGKIVMTAGGGTLYIGHASKDKPAHLKAIGRLGEFIRQHPEGGDITHIVAEYKRSGERTF